MGRRMNSRLVVLAVSGLLAVVLQGLCLPAIALAEATAPDLPASSPASASSEAPSLPSLVWTYMDTADAGQAIELLSRILGDSRATIATVSDALRQGRTFQAAPTGQHPSVPIRISGKPYAYSLSVPESYDPAKSYGLVLCLHGAGFTGDAYLDRWAGRLGDGYILACPSYSMGAWWTRSAEALVLGTIRTVSAQYHIDPDRVFLTGMSNGGIGAWIIGMHHADLFAGLAPMASGIDDVLYPFLANLKQTPVYIIHGAKDQVMPVRLSRALHETLTQLDAPVIYREHEREHPMAGGHYFPKEELPDLVAWFDAQRRGPDPAAAAVVRDATHLGPLGWMRIDATDRIAAFAENLVEGHDELIAGKVYAKLIAGRETDQTVTRVTVAAARVRQYSLFLSDDMFDASKPVQVTTNGQLSYEGRLTPSLESLLKQARARQETRRLYPYQLTITVAAAP